ncbi:WD40 repeat domain-containing protein [Streptomyces xiangluensis]|uniref:WD40 repeat domain-containing protein n=1 Tax=Streptomyces xiangluensis TaxID=2665720 RepID=A0ABV8YV30_9ACTN
MNVDELVRDSLRGQATETVSVPRGFADRVLTVRRRRRTRRLAAVAAATTAAVAIAVAVPTLESGKDDVRLATEKNRNDVIAHPDQLPPRDMIAAGDVALAAYYTLKNVKQTDDRAVAVREYRLLDQKSGTYEKAAKWSFIDVAPGMRTAAVLENDLPTKRIGLLDLFTGEVERWIPVDRGVAGVRFSPDGSKLVATTYSRNPDLQYLVVRDPDGKKDDWRPGSERPCCLSSRTGFYLIDVDSGKGSWNGVASPGHVGNHVRQDFAFSHDGKLVYPTLDSGMRYYDFEGNQVDQPANEKWLHWGYGAGVSPNGKLVATGSVHDVYSVKQDADVVQVSRRQFLAWADNKRLVAWGCAPKTCDGKDGNRRLLLLTIGSDKVVQLSGPRRASTDYPGYWIPLFASR